MEKRLVSLLMAVAMIMTLTLRPAAALAEEGERADELAAISDLKPAEQDGTYDNKADTNYATNAGHVSYTYHEDKTCSYSKQNADGSYIAGSPQMVRTVTITGISFGELKDGSNDMKALQSVILNGRRVDSSDQFRDTITEVKFVNCTFHQTTTTLQVYKIQPVYVTKFTFDGCTFHQEAAGQYAITLNASDVYYANNDNTTTYYRPISYEIVNSVIHSKGRGINITAGTTPESLGSSMTGMPSIHISENTFHIGIDAVALSDNNMAIQIAGNWDNANLTAASTPLITVSNNTIDAYTAIRVHDSMGTNTGESAMYLVGFANNILLNDTLSVVDKGNTDITKKIASSYQETVNGFVTPATGLTVSPASVTLYTNISPNSITLRATMEPSDASDTVIWTSSNPDVATVDGSGVVTAVAPGTATITATAKAGDKSASCTVTVQAPYVPTPPVTPVQPVNPTPTPDPEPDPDPTPGEWTNPYTDVAVNDWYYNAVAYVAAKGLMTGTTASTFAPNDTMTRAMVWTVLARMEGQSVEGGSPWYAMAQSWAMNATVSDGTGPNDSITREQLITMLYRQAGSPEVGVPELAKLGQFSDGEAVSDWAQSAMAWAVSNSILTGEAGALNPQAGATRGQVAAILMRFCQQ